MKKTNKSNEINKIEDNFYIASPIEDDFYIALPNIFNDDLVVFDSVNFKFTKLCLKCGETHRNKTNRIEKRLKEEAANAGGVTSIYSLNISTTNINKKFNATKKNKFDRDIFGHKDIDDHAGNCYENTIFGVYLGNSDRKLCPEYAADVEKLKEEGRFYGDEYMHFEKLVNSWLENKDEDYKNTWKEIIKHEEKYSKSYCRIIIDMLKELFNENFLPFVNCYCEFLEIEPTTKPCKLFYHQKLALKILYKYIIDCMHFIIALLPCRWGKTISMIHLFTNISARLMPVITYIGTVTTSYKNEKYTYTEFKNIQLIDLDSEKDVNNFVYKGGKVMVLLRTTGKIECFNRRIKNIIYIGKKMNLKSNEIFNVLEEIDYGNHLKDKFFKHYCEEITKNFGNSREMTTLAITGTEAWKAEKITAFGNIDRSITVNKNDWNQISC